MITPDWSIHWIQQYKSLKNVSKSKPLFTNNITICKSCTASQHLIPVPTAINVPKLPPPCIIILPTVLTNSLPLAPYLKQMF